MKLKDYQNSYRGSIPTEHLHLVLADVSQLLLDAEPILFKNGKYNPLTATSIMRWVQLGRLALKFIFLVIKIMRK